MNGEIAPLNPLLPDMGGGEDGGSRHQRSTIAFPYVGLDDAISVAHGVFAIGGVGGCDLHQLSAHLGHDAVDSGTFRTKVAGARIFGLILTDGPSIKLTPLGLAILDAESEKRARVEAFLNVPLYKAIWDRYKGQRLPPDVAIERDMVNLGVSPKQKEKARQAFRRSAQQSGFFSYGPDRLVMPPVGSLNSASESDKVGSKVAIPTEPEITSIIKRDLEEARRGSGGPPTELQNVHPAIWGLLMTLPPIGSRWPAEQQEKWLAAVKNTFGLIYPDLS